MDDTTDRGGSSDGDGSDSSRRKSHHQRHTARPIQRLEGAFWECPHPDEKMRMELSKELGLSSRQIKFWFQNKRTQLKITWIEHMEIEDIRPIHNLYMKHVCSGLAFGATRKLATLQRTCERLSCLMDVSNTSYFGGVITSTHGKRKLMKLSQRMVKTFCSSINTVNGQQVIISGMNDLEVRAMLQRCTDPGHPNSIVLSAATTISVPFASVEWDVFSNHNPVKDIGHIACGSHPGNRISVLGASGTSQSNMLILQESCIDSSGALVVYCPIDPHAINIAMSSEDPSVVPILSSGFAIAPDAGENLGPGEMSAGSLVTIVVQIIVSNLTTGTMSQEAVNTINHLVGNTIRQIKAALNCSTC
ncbi:hypothetical protein AgCh_001708 [Apium graveolens]